MIIPQLLPCSSTTIARFCFSFFKIFKSVIAEIVSGRDTPETELDRKELVKAIAEFLDTLKIEKKAYFICRYWHAMSVKDIAEKYGKSENHIAVSLNRIRAKMKEYLTERGF